jgi:anti-sigma B factor antagonist
MDIAHRPFERVDLLTIRGRLDARMAPELQQAIAALFEQGRYRIVLDLTNLEHISSAGLRVLANVRKEARAWKLTDLEGGDIRIANLPPRMKDVFDMTGFTSLFELFPDTISAVGSF